jgi:hypothetical protein
MIEVLVAIAIISLVGLGLSVAKQSKEPAAGSRQPGEWQDSIPPGEWADH